MFNRMKSDDYVRNFVLSRINLYKKSKLLVERGFYDLFPKTRIPEIRTTETKVPTHAGWLRR